MHLYFRRMMIIFELKRIKDSLIFFLVDVILSLSWPQIPTNAAGLIEYRAHPFWSQKYCPRHEHDETPRCCSCERMEVSLEFTNTKSRP